MKFHSRHIFQPLTLLTLLLLSGCIASLPKPLVSMGDLGELKPGNIIVMGKVQLLPPLYEGEQKFVAVGRYKESIYRNSLILLYDDHMRKINNRPRRSDYKRHIVAPFGEYFFIQLPADQAYLIFAELPMKTENAHWPSKYLPAGFRIPFKPGDRAIYVGTLKYYRNKFFDITKVDLVDDYKLAQNVFADRFGRSLKLRKALLQDASD